MSIITKPSSISKDSPATFTLLLGGISTYGDYFQVNKLKIYEV